MATPVVRVQSGSLSLTLEVNAKTTIGAIKHKVHEADPENWPLESIDLVTSDMAPPMRGALGDGGEPSIGARARDNQETIESLWDTWDLPNRWMALSLWPRVFNRATKVWEPTWNKHG
jgi:hypothetical protein